MLIRQTKRDAGDLTLMVLPRRYRDATSLRHFDIRASARRDMLRRLPALSDVGRAQGDDYALLRRYGSSPTPLSKFSASLLERCR